MIGNREFEKAQVRTPRRQPIAVTGIGVVTPFGKGRDKFLSALLAGTDGRAPVTRMDFSDPSYRTRDVGRLPFTNAELDEADAAQSPTLAVWAAVEALAQAGSGAFLGNREKAGVILGTSSCGNENISRFLRARHSGRTAEMDWDLLLSSSSTLSGTVAAKLGIMGHVCTINTACSSGTTSLGFACDLLHSGECDSVLAGGADLVSEVTFAGFNCLQSLTQDRCRPLDGNRSGLMLGEGAAIFCLERRENAIARKAEVLGWILGYSAINEAYHETAPNPTGEGATEAMLLAMKDSGIGVDCIDYVNVHGTATPANDAMEMISLRRVFGDRLESIKVSSTKSQIGHSLGAAGSLELAATLLCMGVGHVPPTLHHQTPMEGYENIDIVLGKAKPWPVRAAISNSFAFAGHLSSIVVHHKNLEIG